MPKLLDVLGRVMIKASVCAAIVNLLAWLLSDDNYSAFLALFNGAMAALLYFQRHPAPKPVDARLFNT